MSVRINFKILEQHGTESSLQFCKVISSQEMEKDCWVLQLAAGRQGYFMCQTSSENDLK